MPDMFVWVGDAVYTKGNSYPALPTAFNQLLSNDNYTEFTSKTYVDGIWDDHDYGVNDGGIRIVDKEQRAQEYMKFLRNSNVNVPSEDEGYLWMDPSGKHGLYHSTTVTMGPYNVKFLFLDTRSFRDDHYIPSLGQIKFPLSAIIASAIRALYSVLGFGRKYAGDVLGAEQWRWLENELETSTADVHFLVSSIQILTSNPVVESWGHFPVAKQRLMDLLAKHDPNNLNFLSGDVHLAEASRAQVHRKDGSISTWMEITSSGMTHTCQDNPINRFLCPAMLYMFPQHRNTLSSFYTKRNIGTIQLLSSKDGYEEGHNLEVSIRSLESSTILQSPFASVNIPLKANVSKGAECSRIEYADFYVIPWYLQILLFINLILFSRYFLVVRSSKKNDRLKKNL
jgi:alkaline phosphatase D